MDPNSKKALYPVWFSPYLLRLVYYLGLSQQRSGLEAVNSNYSVIRSGAEYGTRDP